MSALYYALSAILIEMIDRISKLRSVIVYPVANFYSPDA